MQEDVLFVKIDGYKEILRDVEGARQLLSNLREAISVLKKVSEVKEKSIATFIENLENVSEKISKIEQEFPQVQETPTQIPTEEMVQETPRQNVIESSVRSLHGELENLRNELQDLK